MEYGLNLRHLRVHEELSLRRVSISDVAAFSTLHHSSSAAIAIGCYGEVGYSNTPTSTDASMDEKTLVAKIKIASDAFGPM